MATFTEGFTPGHYLVSEAPGLRSRDSVTLANAGGAAVTFPAGLVLARRTIGAATAAAKSGGNTGNGTITMSPSAPVLAGAKVGIYTVRCISAATNAGTFRVVDPDGFVLGDATITGGAGGTAVWANDIGFTLTDGSTDFAAGDGFDVTIAAGDGAYIPFLNAANLPASAVLWAPVTVAATSTGAAVVTARDAEVVGARLQYDASLSGGTLTAARAAAVLSLNAVGIIAR